MRAGLYFAGANVLATSCPACIIQLAYGVRRHKLPVRVCHLSELIRERLPMESASNAKEKRCRGSLP